MNSRRPAHLQAASVRPLGPRDPRRVGSYDLESKIGEGGMGAVYLGRRADGPLVAVKVVRGELASDPAFLARFRDEVINAERVASFCTAQVLEHGEDAGRTYMVTEYIDGPSLLQHVADNGALSPGMLHGVAVGVAAALVAIHASGLVHRDLKPSNVLLSMSGPRVIDFGIARALDVASAHTATGQVIGSPGWIAPEQILNQSMTPLVDVFAWGCLVSFAGTGRNPFGTGTFQVMAARVVHAEPDIGRLPEPLARLVRRALDKDPGRRPSAQELLLALVGGAGEAAVTSTLDESWVASPPAGARSQPDTGPRTDNRQATHPGAAFAQPPGTQPAAARPQGTPPAAAPPQAPQPGAAFGQGTRPAAAPPGAAQPGVAYGQGASPGAAPPQAAQPGAAYGQGAAPGAAPPHAAQPGAAYGQGTPPAAAPPGAAPPGVAFGQSASPGAGHRLGAPPSGGARDQGGGTEPGIGMSQGTHPGPVGDSATDPARPAPPAGWAPTGPLHEPRRQRRGGVLVAAAAGVLVVTAGVAAGAYALQGSDDDPKGAGKQRAGLSGGSNPARGESAAALPLDPMLVRIDTEEGFPKVCSGRIGKLTPKATGVSAPEKVINGSSCDLLPQWSPDRKQIAFLRQARGTRELWVADAEGKGERKLANKKTVDRMAWSPDGKEIAYSDVTGDVAEIFITDLQGHKRQLTKDGKWKADLAWDGDRLAFFVRAEGGAQQIYYVRPSVKDDKWHPVTTRQMAPDGADDPHWSPDGRQLAFTIKRASENHDLGLVDADGTHFKQLTSGDANEHDPTWSPGGKWLAYVRGQESLIEIWAMPVGEEKKARALTPRRVGHAHWWS